MTPRRKVSISTAFAAAIAGLTGIAVLVLGALWVGNEYTRFARESERLRKSYYDAQGELIRGEVENVLDYVAYRHSKLEAELRATLRRRVYEAHAVASNLYATEIRHRPRAEVERLIREALRPVRFNEGRGYYFAVTMNGVEVLYPVAPNLEGENLLDLRDDNGNFVIRDEIALLGHDEEGFVFDHWRKPNASDQMIYPKITFVKRFEPLGWYLGTGEYLDDFERDVQDEILARIASVRFGNEGYVFVNTYDGQALITDGRRVTDGTNLWELTDPNGVKVIQEERRAAEKPDGDFIHYTWRKLTNDQLAPKVSFIKGYPKWRWMVGAGVYLDQIEPIVAERRAELKQRLRSHLVRIGAAVFGLGTLVVLAAAFFSRRTRRGLTALTDFFGRAATETGPATIDESRLYFTEFAQLADSANAMVASRRQAEEETRHLEEQLHQARKMEALGLLTGGVAHDLNNILSGLVMYPDLMLLDLPPDSPLRQRVQGIKASGQRAAAVVADLLAASRGSRGTTGIVAPNAVIREYLSSPEHRSLRASRPEVDVTVELEEDLLNVAGSRSQLGKAVMNLVANGVDAVEGRGRVRIATCNRWIESPIHGFETVPAGEYVQVSVEDDGTGISERDLAKIFDPFFTKKTLGRSGTGLGLTVVWHTVKSSDGFVDVRSGPGGSRFDLYFPASREQAEGVPAPAPLAQLRGHGEKVLVVDDEEMQRDIARQLLTRLGYDVTLAASGEHAVDLVTRQTFDLVVLDMIMDPGMSGRETYQAILERRPGQTALIVSGYAESDDIQTTLELGAGGSVVKPYTIDQLGKAIRELLGKRHEPPAPAGDDSDSLQ